MWLNPAGTAAVTSREPKRVRSADMRVPKGCGPLPSQERPPALGYSQSMSIPSKTPAQRGSLTRLKHELAKAVGLAAAWPKPPDQVHPPNENRTLRCGYLALSLRSWLKLPRRAPASQVSATPSTLDAA